MYLRVFKFALLFCALCFAQEGGLLQVSESSPVKTGILSVHSSVPAGVWVGGQAVGSTPLSIELSAGWRAYSVRAPGYWTEVFLMDIKPGENTLQEVQLKETKFPPLDGVPDISQEIDVKVLEKLYDSLMLADIVVLPDSVCIAYFAENYPLPSLAPLPLTEQTPEYRSYYATYDSEKTRSFNEWHSGCSMPIQKNLDMIWARINELGTKSINGFVPVVAARFEPSSPDGLHGNLTLIFRSKDSRADVAWVGIWENEFLPGDDLVRALTASEPIALSFITTQNRTLWIPVEGGYSRHFYKYHDLNISWNGLLIPMNKGEFVLPDYIIAQPEIIELPEKISAEEETSVKIAEVQKIQLEYSSIAKIPGGTLGYKGKETDIKPFSINTTLISQNEYNAKCGKKNFGKYKGDSIPAHSINWKEANSCCSILGGDLPTEAEWEYAARAGIPYEYAWVGNAEDYAVFDEKKPVKIASRKPNGWGLYDMFGNVAEWVKDDGFWYGKYKYFKGGSWKSKEIDLKVESSKEEDSRYWGTHVGFRCVFRDY